MVDKTGIILIGFIVIFGMSAALLATGIIPTIIDTVNVANQTKYESINQTDILQDFVTLYLANTLNDTKENTRALASAKASLENQEQSLKNQEQSLRNQQRILNENTNITQDILEISQEHKNAAQSHDTLQRKGDDLIEKINNVTQLSYELLAGHTKNVTKAQVETEEAINKSGR